MKLRDGVVALSPKNAPNGKTLYVSVRDDANWYVQAQAPYSNDWITSAQRDEELRVVGTGFCSIALEGFNERYIAVGEAPDSDGGHTRFRVRSVNRVLVEQSVFFVQNIRLLQTDLEFDQNYTVTIEELLEVAKTAGLTLTRDDASRLQAAFPALNADVLAKQAQSGSCRILTGATGLTIGGVVGALIFGSAGFLIGGPLGAMLAAGIGAAAGGNIGMGVEVTSEVMSKETPAPAHVVDSKLQHVASTKVTITPVGGPYKNQHWDEDLMRLTKFPRIGDADFDKAGILMPPTSGNVAQVYYPASKTTGSYPKDIEKFGKMTRLEMEDLYKVIFVVAKLDDGKFQLRLHPDRPLINTKDRPNHSQLTDGHRAWALLSSTKEQEVYAAGEMYATVAGVIKGLTAKTGHYWDKSSSFNSNVYATTRRMLTALGYDISGLLEGDRFWDWFNGEP
ncbi:hypothetical protein JRI60_49920 [Archangium violaceum]|uniref:hypothetical protein n=1 Tax=Archangium violaceum TaxID=83451 RepID=UPI00194F072E|nr:hypothetical protein [Archangium violaceum]QRN96996.1 hypothetical protein JRI60_49920 [Archangium violaceum]